MSIRAERLKSHPVWPSLDALGAATDDALKREGLSPSDVDNLARIRSVLALAGKRLAGLDSQTIHFGLLDATANSLNDVAAHVRNFASNGNSGHLDQANASADNAIGSLAAVTVETSEGFIWAKEAAQAYQLGLATVMASAETTGAKVQEDLTGIQARQAELVAEITNEKQRIAACSRRSTRPATATSTSRSPAAATPSGGRAPTRCASTRPSSGAGRGPGSRRSGRAVGARPWAS